MISILLTTYNGEKYLREQLDSLISQTVLPDAIYITDDCSTDDTWDIVKKYQKRYPNIIISKRLEKNSGSAKHNFLSMMVDVKDDYIMLCDQDDVWMPHKIEVTLSKMKELEDTFGSNLPLLVHTDLKVVDEKLNVISESFEKFSQLKLPFTFKETIVKNFIIGCSVMYNKSLANKISKKPKSAVMHDWWLALIATSSGKVGYVDNATINYRQHGTNQIGTEDTTSLIYKINVLKNRKKNKEEFFLSCDQANEFLNMYLNDLSDCDKKMLKIYSNTKNMRKLKRIKVLTKNQFINKGFIPKLRYLIYT